MTDALKNIEKLVAQIAEKAASGDTSQDEKMDAAKLLQPYYTAMKKAKGRLDDESSDDEPTMGDLQKRLRLVEQEPPDGRVSPSTRR